MRLADEQPMKTSQGASRAAAHKGARTKREKGMHTKEQEE